MPRSWFKMTGCCRPAPWNRAFTQVAVLVGHASSSRPRPLASPTRAGPVSDSAFLGPPTYRAVQCGRPEGHPTGGFRALTGPGRSTVLSLAATKGPRPARPRTRVRCGPKPRTGSARALDSLPDLPRPQSGHRHPHLSGRGVRGPVQFVLPSPSQRSASLGGTKKAPDGCANHRAGQGSSYHSGSSFCARCLTPVQTGRFQALLVPSAPRKMLGCWPAFPS